MPGITARHPSVSRRQRTSNQGCGQNSSCSKRGDLSHVCLCGDIAGPSRCRRNICSSAVSDIFTGYKKLDLNTKVERLRAASGLHAHGSVHLKLLSAVQRTTSQARTSHRYYQIILENDQIQYANPFLTHVIKDMDICDMINCGFRLVLVLTGPETLPALFVYSVQADCKIEHE